MKQIEKTIAIAQLDEAASAAQKNAQEGVNMVVALLNNAKTEEDRQFVMDGASARGFHCEFWPSGGGVSVRVTWGML